VFNKSKYKLTLDDNLIKGMVNKNLLKKYYTRDIWKPVIIIKKDNFSLLSKIFNKIDKILKYIKKNQKVSLL